MDYLHKMRFEAERQFWSKLRCFHAFSDRRDRLPCPEASTTLYSLLGKEAYVTIKSPDEGKPVSISLFYQGCDKGEGYVWNTIKKRGETERGRRYRRSLCIIFVWRNGHFPVRGCVAKKSIGEAATAFAARKKRELSVA